MREDPIPELMMQIHEDRLWAHINFLAADPLPYRKLNYTRPGQDRCTLYEADDYIASGLEAFGYVVEKEGVPVQAFRRDESKPKSAQWATPAPEDPWYTAYNIYGRKPGREFPEEIIVVVSHKDSQSWVDSPGAYDNAVGTAANLEIARVLSGYANRRSLYFLYCNEEHWPWTSVVAAQNARARGDNIIAVFNVDSVGGKSEAERAAGMMTNVTLFTTPEGEWLADLMAQVNEEYAIGLQQRKQQRSAPGDDDGSFVKAGYGAAIMNVGSYPYADAAYHTEADRPERVDLPNVLLAAQATLAAIVRVDQAGVPQRA